jgi:hypothetical protein
MKFYILDTNEPEIVAAEKPAPDKKLSPGHEEYFLPPSGVFISLPNTLLTAIVKNSTNEYRQRRDEF